ncbi:MAG: hypothetical protein U9N61_02760 [Euryarchaeota archaeon]|nr:hypothetical protein [Euryarchaeota archaeon]
MTVIPEEKEYTFYQGAEWTKTYTFNNKDWTGYAARMQLRTSYADKAATADVSLTEGDGLTFTVVDTSTATLAISIGADVTEDLSNDTYRFDIEFFVSGDTTKVDRVIYGTFTNDKEVTRD